MHKTTERIQMKTTLRDNLDIQTTYEELIVRNSSRCTIVTQLHYLTNDRKCAQDRLESVKTIVLNGSVGQFLT